jgi:predicted dehydrogenase
MEKLRMGVIGTSGHYELRVATPLKSSLLVEPYAIASRNLETARAYAQKWDFSRAYGSYEELLADPDIDFVYTPLPNYLHLELIKKAADAGKPVICEKPLGLNAKEAVEAAEYCAKKGVPVMEAFMYRFHPQWRRAAEIVKCGEIGTVVSTSGLFSYNLKDGSNIRNIAEYGGGAILDIGCYTVSSARFLMEGEPERVIASFIRDPAFKTDVLGSAILDFGGGRTSTFTISTQMFFYQRVTAIGTGGALSIKIPFNMPGTAPGELTVATGAGERLVESKIANQYLLEFDGFAESIVNKTGVPTPVGDAVSNMAVLDALFASIVSGQWERVLKY